MTIDSVLFISAIIILIASVVLSFKTRFIQFRMLPYMAKSLFASLRGKGKAESAGDTKGEYKILPHRALFTAMSTTFAEKRFAYPILLPVSFSIMKRALSMPFFTALTYV